MHFYADFPLCLLLFLLPADLYGWGPLAFLLFSVLEINEAGGGFPSINPFPLHQSILSMKSLRFPIFLMLAWLALPVSAQTSYKYHFKQINSKEGGFDGKLKRGDEFGAGIALIGDVDGDSIPDLAVGARLDDDGGSDNGAVWILFMNKDATVRKEQKISFKEGHFMGKLSPGGQFGSAIIGMGDLDGDTIPDMAVSEPMASVGGLRNGRVWLIFLNRDGTVKSQSAISNIEGGFGGRLGADYQFGRSLAYLGDINGDTLPDIAVGAPMQDRVGPGELWILFLDKDGSVKSEQKVGNGAGGFTGNLAMSDFFGISVEVLGDQNRDGVVDLVVGAMGDNDQGTENGALYVLFLNRDGTVKQQQKISEIYGGFGGRLDNGDRMGVSVAAIGDINADGGQDIAVGSYRDDGGGTNKGAVWIMMLDQDGRVVDHHKICQECPNFKGEFSAKYEWALDVEHIGRLHDEGVDYLAVSGNHDNEGGVAKGGLWLLFRARERENWAQGKPRANPGGTFYQFESDNKEYVAYHEAKLDSLSQSLDEASYNLSDYAENNLIFLLDVSASMRHSEKLPLLQQAFVRLLDYMRPEDRISIITYSGNPAIELDGVSAAYRDSIVNTIKNLQSSGSTETFKALKTAYGLARRNFVSEGNNRIILATDGGFEIPELHELTDEYGSGEIPLSVFYFGKLPEYKIINLHVLARRGYGNCAFISRESAIAALLREVKAVRK